MKTPPTPPTLTDGPQRPHKPRRRVAARHPRPATRTARTCQFRSQPILAARTAPRPGWNQYVQFRAPPAAELAVYNASLQSGALTTAQVQSSIIGDVFTTTIVNPVIREYQAAFGRVPDAAGSAFWVGQVAANPTVGLANLGTTFANSAEFTARFGATATTVANSALVSALYTNVYGRAPDAAGLAFWAGSGLTAASQGVKNLKIYEQACGP